MLVVSRSVILVACRRTISSSAHGNHPTFVASACPTDMDAEAAESVAVAAAPATPRRLTEELVEVNLSDGGETPKSSQALGDDAHGLKCSASAPQVSSLEAGARLHALLDSGARSESTSHLDALPASPHPAHYGEKAAEPTAPDAAARTATHALACPCPPGARTDERVALFDLDLTLLDVNTGRLWVEQEFRQGKVPFQIYLRAVYWFAMYAAGLGVDAGRIACEAMAFYQGQSDADMQAQVDAFWTDQCALRLRPGAAAALAEHRAKGERVVLCTASWQHVAAAARRSFAMDGAICSVIQVGDDGRFTGGVSDAYGEGKWARTVEWAQAEGVDLQNCTFYTDSFSDRRLLEAVGTPVAVCPDSRLADHARKQGWRTEDWGEATQLEHPAKSRYSCAVFGLSGCL